jgi:membrane protein DedA with SNARE-associated domain
VSDLEQLLAQHGVLLVLAASFAARAGLPVPAAPLVVVAGALSVTGTLPFWPMAAASVAGNLFGDAIWFAAGRRYGHRVMRLLCQLSLSPDSCVRQSETLIARWGGSALIAGKFVPGVSAVAPPMAGALGMSLARFSFSIWPAQSPGRLSTRCSASPSPTTSRPFWARWPTSG